LITARGITAQKWRCETQGSDRDQIRRAMRRGRGGDISRATEECDGLRESSSREDGAEVEIARMGGSTFVVVRIGGELCCCAVQHGGTLLCGGQWLHTGCAVW
jgi:hypothetical protein